MLKLELHYNQYVNLFSMPHKIHVIAIKYNNFNCVLILVHEKKFMFVLLYCVSVSNRKIK